MADRPVSIRQWCRVVFRKGLGRGLTVAASFAGFAAGGNRGRRLRRAAQRGATALEFGLVALPFLVVLLFVFELSYDLFTQETLDSALHLAARQIQTGNAQNVQNGNDFNNRYLCPSLGGLINCTGLYVSVKSFVPAGNQDFYNITTGIIPVTAGALDLTSYASGSFCNAGPSQFVVISAIYVGPSFIGGLFQNGLAVLYGGAWVHPTLSTTGFVSEAYQASARTAGAAPSC